MNGATNPKRFAQIGLFQPIGEEKILANADPAQMQKERCGKGTKSSAFLAKIELEGETKTCSQLEPRGSQPGGDLVHTR